jgi:hypothetical protein
MHLIIAAFIYLGLASPGSTISETDILNHQSDIEQVQEDPDFMDFCNRLTESTGIFVVDIDELH